MKWEFEKEMMCGMRYKNRYYSVSCNIFEKIFFLTSELFCTNFANIEEKKLKLWVSII
jgi:hypothetical protein